MIPTNGLELSPDAAWIEELLPEDFPVALQEMIAELGPDGPRLMARLVLVAPGGQIYIPRPEKVLRRVRDLYLKADHKAGMGYRELAQKYGVCEQWVRRIVDHQGQKAGKQQSMFAGED